MAINTIITITHGTEQLGDVQRMLSVPAGASHKQAQRIEAYMNGLEGGVRVATMDVQINGGSTGAQATGSFHGVSVVATNTAVIAGVTFTAVASGAGAHQFNVGGSDTLTCANLAAAINADAVIGGMVTAVAGGAFVNITAVPYGAIGNLIATTATGGLSAATGTLTGGVNTTANIYHYGQ